MAKTAQQKLVLADDNRKRYYSRVQLNYDLIAKLADPKSKADFLIRCESLEETYQKYEKTLEIINELNTLVDSEDQYTDVLSSSKSMDEMYFAIKGAYRLHKPKPEPIETPQLPNPASAPQAPPIIVDTSMQYDQVRAYLKELDVNNLVWIGLKKEASRFAWRDASVLEGEGYWLESPPKEQEALCAALDPLNDYRWKTFNCAGPDTATFICEIPIPEWADHGYTGCMLDSLPSLTITYHPEDESVHLLHDCGLDGSRTVACKGTADKRDLMMLLHCNQNISTWYKGMWDSAISVAARHRRSSSLPGEFTTPTHFVFANDLFDYDEDETKTTAHSSKTNEDNLDSNMKADGTSAQDFMVGFAPEDLSFADEPIKSLPPGTFPVIPDHNFEKSVAEGNIVYNSSTTETLSKLTVGTETQLVRSINNTNNNLKSETSTVPLEASTSTVKVVPKNNSKGLKEMLVSGMDNVEKGLEKTTKETGVLLETSAKKLSKAYETTKAKMSESLKSLKDDTLKTIKNKDMDVHTEPAMSEQYSVKQLVGESLTLQKENGETKIKEKVPKIDRNIDFLETGSNKFDSSEHAQNYVNAGTQNLLDKTEKKISGLKTFAKDKVKFDQVATQILSLTRNEPKITQTATHSTAQFTETAQTTGTTPGAFKKEILKALEEVKQKSLETLDEINTPFKTLYDKVIPTVKVGEEIKTKKVEMTTRTIPSTTEKSTETITDNKQFDTSVKSTPVSVVHQTGHKRIEESPGLVILDSKGHSLDSNEFESHSEDELDFERTTENHLEFKPYFENEINVSKKSVPAASAVLTNMTSSQTVYGSRSSVSTTAKYERRNLPPVLMIDKVEQLNEAAAGIAAVTTDSTSINSAAGSTTTTAGRTESQSIKKGLPAVLGNKQPLVPTTVKSSTSSEESTGAPLTSTKKVVVEPVPDLPEKPKRSPLFPQQQHRSHYPYFLGRILG